MTSPTQTVRGAETGPSQATFRHWSAERVAKFTSLWASGAPREEIAAALGVTVKAVDLKRSSLKLAPRPAWNATAWPAERIEQLRNLHAEGRNDRQIGSVMGLTDATVQRKRTALGLASLFVATPSVRAPRPFVRTEAAWEPLPGTTPKTLLELERGDCRWPLGESPFTFCGEQVDHGSSYCKAHAAISGANHARS